MKQTMTCIAVAALSLPFLAAPARADDADCKNPMNQSEMNICSLQDYEAADAKLNAAYRGLMKKLGDDSAAQDKLKIAQRAWIAFRDSECDFEGHSAEGGSMQPMLVNGCMARLTEQRTKDLADPPT